MGFKDHFLKKVVSCPSCSQKLRIPIKRGKRLRVTCSRCHCQFDISFASPLVQLFKWYSGRGFKYNAKSFLLRLKALPLRSLLILLILFLLVLYLFLPRPSQNKSYEPRMSDEIII